MWPRSKPLNVLQLSAALQLVPIMRLRGSSLKVKGCEAYKPDLYRKPIAELYLPLTCRLCANAWPTHQGMARLELTS